MSSGSFLINRANSTNIRLVGNIKDRYPLISPLSSSHTHTSEDDSIHPEMSYPSQNASVPPMRKGAKIRRITLIDTVKKNSPFASLLDIGSTHSFLSMADILSNLNICERPSCLCCLTSPIQPSEVMIIPLGPTHTTDSFSRSGSLCAMSRTKRMRNESFGEIDLPFLWKWRGISGILF